MEPYEGVSAECSLCGGEIYRGEDYYAPAPFLVKGG